MKFIKKPELYVAFFFILLILTTLSTQRNIGTNKEDHESIVFLETSAIHYTNASIVSDGYQGSYWNKGYSFNPQIALDNNDIAHVVWSDEYNRSHGLDIETFFASWSEGNDEWDNVSFPSDTSLNWGWSLNPAIAIDNDNIYVVWEDLTDLWRSPDSDIYFANYSFTNEEWMNYNYTMNDPSSYDTLSIVISDSKTPMGSGFPKDEVTTYGWNSGDSGAPAITVDSSGAIHIVWHDDTDGAWGTDTEIMYVNWSTSDGWSNVLVLTDSLADGISGEPEIASDTSGGIHIVWQEGANGAWGADTEIMYMNYTTSDGWSTPEVISDGFSGVYWNNGESTICDIAVDDSDNIHVVWQDTTDGKWGSDIEIMYVNRTGSKGWTNITIVSDGYQDQYWNGVDSGDPAISTYSDTEVHIVFENLNFEGSTYKDILYVNYSNSLGWDNVSCLSNLYDGSPADGGDSINPDIAVDSTGVFHAVWNDDTDGYWGNDIEIMGVQKAAFFEQPPSPPPTTVSSSGGGGGGGGGSKKGIFGYDTIVLFGIITVSTFFLGKKMRKSKI